MRMPFVLSCAGALALAMAHSASAQSASSLEKCDKPLATARVEVQMGTEADIWQKEHLLPLNQAVLNMMKYSGCFIDAHSTGSIPDYKLSVAMQQAAVALPDGHLDAKVFIPIIGPALAFNAAHREEENLIGVRVSYMLMNLRTFMVSGQSDANSKNISATVDMTQSQDLFMQAGFKPSAGAQAIENAEVTAFNALIEDFKDRSNDPSPLDNPLLKAALAQQAARSH